MPGSRKEKPLHAAWPRVGVINPAMRVVSGRTPSPLSILLRIIVAEAISSSRRLDQDITIQTATSFLFADSVLNVSVPQNASGAVESTAGPKE